MKEQKNNQKSNIEKKIKPLADRVLIKEDTESKEKKTSSGIIIPVTVNEDKGSKRGEVVAVGPGRIEDGQLVELSVKAGDIVLFQWGDKVRIGEEDYYLVRESEILAIIK
jgi:chaperonin GroES